MDNTLPDEFDLVIVGTGIHFLFTVFCSWNKKENELFTIF